MNKLNILLTCALFTMGLSSSCVYAQNETPQLSDAEIASVAVTANQIDVEYGIIALETSGNDKVRDFAQNMVLDHTKIIKLATDLVTKLGVTPKDNAVSQSLRAQAKKTKAMLHSKSGDAFNKAYVDNEVAYHEAVINAVENVLIPQADNAELKSLLKTALPLLKSHLEHAKMVQKNMK